MYVGFENYCKINMGPNASGFRISFMMLWPKDLASLKCIDSLIFGQPPRAPGCNRHKWVGWTVEIPEPQNGSCHPGGDDWILCFGVVPSLITCIDTLSSWELIYPLQKRYFLSRWYVDDFPFTSRKKGGIYFFFSFPKGGDIHLLTP